MDAARDVWYGAVSAFFEKRHFACCASEVREWPGRRLTTPLRTQLNPKPGSSLAPRFLRGRWACAHGSFRRLARSMFLSARSLSHTWRRRLACAVMACAPLFAHAIRAGAQEHDMSKMDH